MATRDIELDEIATDSAAPTRSIDGKHAASARLSMRSSAAIERIFLARRPSAALAQSSAAVPAAMMPTAAPAKLPSAALARRPSAAVADPAPFTSAEALARLSSASPAQSAPADADMTLTVFTNGESVEKSPAEDLARRPPEDLIRRPSAAPALFTSAPEPHISAVPEVRSYLAPSLRPSTSRSAPQPFITSPAAGGKGAVEPLDAPKTMMDKLVAALVVAGIIVFTVFQIRESVLAHENPSTKSSVEVVPRTFPGLMMCPYSFDQARTNDVCPKWRSDALLQYEFGDAFLMNSNRHSASSRTNTRCPVNHGYTTGFGNSLLFAFGSSEASDLNPTIFFQKVTIKNSAGPTLKCSERIDFLNCKNSSHSVTFPYLCPSWTPPNVECTVFDPHHFDRQAKVYGMDPMCNPMKEAVANTLDSVSLYTGTVSPDVPVGYKYSGLIPQPNSNSPTSVDGQSIQDFHLNPWNLFKNLPTDLFARQSDLDGQFGHLLNANFSLFAGVVAVLYDPSKGVPKSLNFDNARDNSMSEDILASTVLWHTKCGQSIESVSNPSPNDARLRCPQEKLPSIDFFITAQVDFTFSNKFLQSLTNKTNYTAAKQPFAKRPDCMNWENSDCRAYLRILFTSSSTVINTQIINLSILTTVSIVLSTAGTLWGSQEKIKAGIVLVKAKLYAKKQDVDVTSTRQA